MELVLLFLFSALLLVGSIVLVCWALYHWQRRKGNRRLALLLPGLLMSGIGYCVHFAIYPNDAFYHDEFRSITGVPLPASADIQRKDASYPDQHGAYAACARIRLAPADYTNLLLRLRRDTTFQSLSSPKFLFIHSDTFEYVNPGVDVKLTCSAAYSSIYRPYKFVGFLRDGKTIIIYRTSS
ncbi:hypothetical protein [Solirubrum puertoriconensis]|uniref:Uncharacterized protein n=1 Tax=Solirubrum puertoriconensis TaxID=1751427 RepID=A0A9X0HMA8_SOLP1|nr:hypothetical protein [Solirubrum puertoriconensis]KUG08617.1 hypothetical protein ASU33_10735 [Solirubrum puertoriconensis]